jgi:hypothetical protein
VSYIFPFLCKDVVALEELYAVALTSRQGYHLVQDSSLWKPLKETLYRNYFAHVPEDALLSLIKNQDLPPIALAHILYQRFVIDLTESEQTFEILLNQPLFRSRYPMYSKGYCYDIFKGIRAQGRIYLRLEKFRFRNRPRYPNDQIFA